MDLRKWINKHCKFAQVAVEEDVGVKHDVGTGNFNPPPENWDGDEGNDLTPEQESLIWHRVLKVMEEPDIINKIKPLFPTFLSTSKRESTASIDNVRPSEGVANFSLWMGFRFGVSLEQLELQTQSFLRSHNEVWEHFRQDQQLLQKLPSTYSELKFISDEHVLDAAIRIFMTTFEKEGEVLLTTSPLFSPEKAQKVFHSYLGVKLKNNRNFLPDLVDIITPTLATSEMGENEWEELWGKIDGALKQHMTKEDLNPIYFLDLNFITATPTRIFTFHNASYVEKEMVTLQLSRQFNVRVPVEEDIYKKAVSVLS